MDRLERELEGQARVVRLSILSKIGREAAQRHGVRGVPTFLVFDDRGDLIERQIGFPDRNKIKGLVAGTV
ncbi:MAG: thioredoxin family protein [Chloroflexota bacterium]|nr:thioredoxin family protein [Chloroflexota bacterium]